MVEIVTIQTARVRVTWSGAPPEAGLTRVRVLRGVGHVEASSETMPAAPEADVPMAIREESILSLLVESRSGKPVEVLHRDPGQTSGLTRANNGRLMHGSVRVRDDAGWSVFTVLVDGTPEAEIALHVVPSKLTVEDVAAMRGDVERVWRGAALAAWSAAQEPADASSPESSAPAWVTLLRHAVARLEGPLAEITRRPEFELRQNEHIVSATRLRGDARSLRAIRRQRGTGDFHAVAGVPVRARVPAPVLRADADVAAHRWIRQRLDAASHALTRITREEASHPYAEHGRRRALGQDLDRMATAIHRYRRQRPLADAATGTPVRRAPLVLRRRPVYRQVFETLRLLEYGLAVGGQEVETAWLGTARLYETWAVLQVVRVAARVLGTPAPEAPFGLVASGASVRVGRGRHRAVILRGESGSLEIAYEPRFAGPPGLLAQRPDVLLTFRASGAPPRRAVLDAKYRRDDSDAYAARHGAAGPPEAALGDLHRYRDAITDVSGDALVDVAAALYPHRAAPSFENARLWRANAEIGIGAIPLVPGDDVWLERWLSRWIGNDRST